MPGADELLRRQRALGDFGDFVLDHDELQAVLDEGCRLVAEALGADLAKVLEIDQATDTALVRAGVGWNAGVVGKERISLSERSSEAFAIETAEPVITNDIAEETRFHFPGFLKEHGVIALVNVPIFLPGRKPWGVLQVDARERREFEQGDIEFLRTYSMVLGPVIDRLEKLTGLRESEEKYRTLFRSIDEGFAVVEMIYDEAGEIVDIVVREVNRAFEHHTGLTGVVGRSMFDVVPGFEDHWLEPYKRAATTGEPERVENYQEDLGRWFDVYFSRVDGAGRFVATIFDDVSARKQAEVELRDRETRQAFLLKLSDILQRLTVPDEFKAAAMQLLGTQLGVSRAQYHEVDSSGEYYSADGIGFADGLPLLDLKYKIDQFGSFVAENFEAGRPFRSDDLVSDPRPLPEEREAYALYGIRAGAGIPLLRGGKLVAILAVHDVRVHAWSDLEMELIRETAERVWVAVEKLRTETAVRETQEHQRFLLRLSDTLRSEPDEGAVARRAIGLVAEYLDLDRCYITAFHPNDNVWRTEYQLDRRVMPPMPAVVRPADHPASQGQVTEQTLLFSDISHDPSLSELDKASYAQMGMGALVAPALRRVDDDVLWCFVAVSRSPRTWTRAEVTLIEDAAERVWTAMLRTRSEAALRASEERMRRVAETPTVGLLFFDRGGTLIDANAAFLRITGYTREQVETRSLTWQKMTPPEWHQASEVQMEKMLSTGRLGPYQKEYFRADGSRLWMLFAGRDLGDGTFVEYAVDTTDRKRAEQALRESEERFRRFGEASSDLLWIRNAESLAFEYVSTAFERLYGVSRNHVLEGNNVRGWLDLIHPEDRDDAVDALKRLRNGIPSTHEFRIIRPDGTVRWIQDTDFPMLDETGKVERIAGIAADVTEEKRAVELQRTLLAELQHRVRNVLAMIRSLVRRTGSTKVDVAEFVEHLEGRIDAMARTQALLTRAPEKGVNLEDLIRDELVAQSAGDLKYRLKGPRVALPGKAAELLTLAVHELATNSVKYGVLGQSDGRVVVTWNIAETDGATWLEFSWREDGLKNASSNRQGFGTELISRRVPYELGGRGEILFGDHSLTATIEFPLRTGDSFLDTAMAAEGQR